MPEQGSAQGVGNITVYYGANERRLLMMISVPSRSGKTAVRNAPTE